jgi:hypothetical protein
MVEDSKRRHVFISPHFADDTHVDKLNSIMADAGYDVRNSSIRLKDANKQRLEQGRVSDNTLKRLLRMKISWAGAIIVLIGKDTHKRPWVNWEIEQANRLGKRIVGVYAPEGTNSDISRELEKYASSIVPCHPTSVIGAIDGTRPTFQNPDGTPRAATHDPSSDQCN